MKIPFIQMRVEFFPNMDFSHVNQRPSHVLAKKNPEEPAFNPVLGGLKFTKNRSSDYLSSDTCHRFLSNSHFDWKAFS